MNDLKIFTYNDVQFRTITKSDGEKWFVLKDVCDILGLTNSRMIAERLDDDEKGVSQIYTPGGKQEMTVISESGLYNVILRSDKPEAKPFRKWVTAEVLPSIRRHGIYAVDELLNDPDTMIKALTALKEEREKRATLEAKIEQDKPKVLFASAVECSKNSILIGDMAKLLRQNGYEIGQQRLFEKLRNEGYLMKTGSSRNMPTQRYMEMGLFEIKESTVNNPDGTIRTTKTTKVTGKGQTYFVNKFLNSENM